MEIRKRVRTEQKVILELEVWEARDLEKMLSRINHQGRVSKSEFSLREKITGRKILTGLRTVKQDAKHRMSGA